MDQKLIKSQCQRCNQPIEFPPEGIGLVVDCPHCGQTTTLCDGFSQNAESLSAEDLRAAFAETVPRSKIHLFYQLALALVAVFMILLPAIYVGFIGLAGWGVYWYAVHAKVILTDFAGGLPLYLFRLVIYCGPVFGEVSLFFSCSSPCSPAIQKSPRHWS